MTIFNTAVAVVANLDADTPAAAISHLTSAVTAAGFEVMETYDGKTPDAFEAEPGTEADTRPAALSMAAPSVWVGVGEYGSEYADANPIAVAGTTEAAAQLALANRVREFIDMLAVSKDARNYYGTDHDNAVAFLAENPDQTADPAVWLNNLSDFDAPIFTSIERVTLH